MASGTFTLYKDFTGGINLAVAPYLLNERECRDALNVHITRAGALGKRCGMVKYMNDTAPLLESVHSLFALGDAATPMLFAVGKQAGASNDRMVSVAGDGTVTTVVSGLTLGKRWESVRGPISGGQGPLFVMNGVDTPRWLNYDGVTVTTGAWTAVHGTVPAATNILLYHLDKVWASGDPSFPGRVWSTGVNGNTVPLPDPREWDTDFIDDVNPTDAQPITALGSCGPYVVVFKPHSMFVLSDPVGRAYRPISSAVGCCAKRSVVETEFGTMFLSETHGVCVTDGATVRSVSKQIQPLLDQVADSNAGNLVNAVAAYHDGSYWLSIPTVGSNNDLVLEYQFEHQSWWKHSGGVNDWCSLDPLGQPKLFRAEAAVKQINEALVDGVFTDVDVPFESRWDGPYWVWGDPHRNKRLSQFRADGAGQWKMFAKTTFTDEYGLLDELLWESDATVAGGFGQDNSVLWGDTNVQFGPAPGIAERRYYTPGWGRAWSVRVSNSDTLPLELFSVSSFVRPRTD